MKKLSIIFILLISISQLKAQYTSLPAARFSVVEKNGCGPFTVTITAPECDGSISCTAIYGDGVLQGFQTGVTAPHVYSTPGNYNLQIVFGTSGTESLAIQVTPNIQPTFELYACTGNEIFVSVTDTNYDQYYIDYDDLVQVIVPRGNLAKDQHLHSSGPHTVNVRGRNLNSANNCASSSQTISVTPTLQPAFISQLEVLSASQIKLDYNNPPVSNQLNTQYRLEIAPNNNVAFQQLQTIFNTTTTTVANVTPDNNYYCFRMGTIDICSSPSIPISYSNIICSANFDLNIQSDVNRLTWVTHSAPGSNVSNFAISKNPGVPLSALPSDPSVDDTNIVCNTDYCYQLTTNYTNGSRSISLQKCGKSFSDVTPLPVEDISSVVSESGVELTWLQYPGFTPTEYSITKSTNGSFSILANTILPTYSDV
ncbi:MAG TPA: hypothetical protein PKU83_07260, partial [Chryseolinea sp.]|nr:hypothetical protein [Chryseolinea sp.]